MSNHTHRLEQDDEKDNGAAPRSRFLEEKS